MVLEPMKSSNFPDRDIVGAIILLGVLQAFLEVFCGVRHQI